MLNLYAIWLNEIFLITCKVSVIALFDYFPNYYTKKFNLLCIVKFLNLCRFLACVPASPFSFRVADDEAIWVCNFFEKVLFVIIYLSSVIQL